MLHCTRCYDLLVPPCRYLADAVDALHISSVIARQLEVLVHGRVDVDGIHDGVVVVVVQQAEHMTDLMHCNLQHVQLRHTARCHRNNRPWRALYYEVNCAVVLSTALRVRPVRRSVRLSRTGY